MSTPPSTSRRGAGSCRRLAGGRLAAVTGGLVALGLGIVAPANAAPIAPTFGTAGGSPFAAGNRPADVVLGSFGTDANLDAAVADEATGSGNSIATILSGNGVGGLTATQTRTVQNRPLAIASGRFDAGTTLDLVVANSGSDRLTILRGNGDGTFATGTSATTGERPVALAVGDVDNDGRLDIAVANYDDDDVSIMKGDGAAGFTSIGSPDMGDRPVGVLLVRLNADANLDLVTTNENDDDISVRLGNGNGTFGAEVTVNVGDRPHGLAAADLDGDGDQDVVVANTNSDTLTILLGTGAGALVAQPSPPAMGTNSEPMGIAIGNLNGDADPDIVATGANLDRVSVLAGNGNGTFVARSDITVGNEPVAVAIGDLNADARQDLVVANRSANTVSVLLNSTAATVSVTAPATLAFGAVVPGASVGPLAAAVTVVSNARGGYQLSVSRTPFTRGDIPLGVAGSTAPPGAIADLPAGTSAVPTTGSRSIGRRSTTVTRSTGDVWNLAFTLGPVPFVADGQHVSTLTYTVVGLP